MPVATAFESIWAGEVAQQVATNSDYAKELLDSHGAIDRRPMRCQATTRNPGLIRSSGPKADRICCSCQSLRAGALG